MKAGKRNTVIFVFLVLLLALAFFMQLFLGSVTIPFKEVLIALQGSPQPDNTWTNIILQSRLPGALAALFAGAGLSISGLQMQTLFRNPVAGPYVLGINAGASLGVAVFILAASAFGISPQVHILSGWSIIIAASAGAVLIFIFNFLIAYKLGDVVAILIIGLMIGGGINALIEILQAFSSNEALKNYVLWTFGSFRYVNSDQVLYLIGIVAVATVFSFALSKPLNLLLMGDNYAVSSGLNIRSSKIMIVLCTSVLAGSITAFCGPIGFVGLANYPILRDRYSAMPTIRCLRPAVRLLERLYAVSVIFLPPVWGLSMCCRLMQ